MYLFCTKYVFNKITHGIILVLLQVLKHHPMEAHSKLSEDGVHVLAVQTKTDGV